MTPKQQPYGFWPSALTSEQLASASIKVAAPKLYKAGAVWLQSLPAEGGRTTLMYSDGHQVRSLVQAPWDIRSKAHEYGGGAYTVFGDACYFVNAKDQNIYVAAIDELCLSDSVSHSLSENTVSKPKPLTQNSHSRYADLQTIDGQWLFAVRETFESDGGRSEHQEPNAAIVAIEISTGRELTLATGEDFYTGLALSPCNTKLAFVSWNHPDMPWDNTKLWEFHWPAGAIEHAINNGAPTCVVSDRGQAIVQPGYSPAGELIYVSDQRNWWNLYRAGQPLCEYPAEFATPQWTFGMKNWGFIDDNTILAAASQKGLWQLCTIDIAIGELSVLTHEFSSISDVQCDSVSGKATFLGSTPTASSKPFIVENGQWQSLVEQKAEESITDKDVLEPCDISVATTYSFTADDGKEVQLFYYPPVNSRYQATDESLPPVIVIGHGGPTGATDAGLNLKIQYWTQRGFAVADVNYRGSTGFGREFRHSLQGAWGVKDVHDLCAAAEFLVANKLAHPEQKIIKGSSAGGYSVLAALTQHSTFSAGVSLYGIADLHTLATDTHKFEAHYLDGLIGPYPEQADEYTTRSPINHVDNLNCPILVAQGLDDKVVPPSQAELIVEAAKKRGLPVVYLAFEGEGHGFRQAATLEALFSAELEFYQTHLLSA